MSGRSGEGSLVIRSTLSTTPLAGTATFTGTATKVPKGIRRVIVDGFADAAGTIFIELSLNGTSNWRPVAAAGTAVAANTLVSAEAQLVYPFFRVRYVNGAGAQSVFELTQMLQSTGAFA